MMAADLGSPQKKFELDTSKESEMAAEDLISWPCSSLSSACVKFARL